MSGLETAAHITKLHPHTRVLMLSMHDSEEYVLQALRVGASGYLLKESSANELELAVRTVARGGIYLSPGVSRHSRHLVASYFSSQAASPSAPARETPNHATEASLAPVPSHAPAASSDAITLTPRQQEILRLLARGFSNGQIARHLTISIKTVESHRAQLMTRLNIFDIAGLVRYAIRHGYAEPL
jgi:DNA-binding NarL/FixJ family response regulator